MLSSGLSPKREDLLIKDLSKLHGKIGILGGSHDPVHLDHEALAHAVKAQHGLNALVFLPTPHNPLKGQSLFSEKQRLEMLLGVAAANSNFYVCSLEIDNYIEGKKTYTVDTLDLLNQNKNPSAELYFILGADCLPELPLWKDFHDLFIKAKIIPVARGETKEAALQEIKTAGQLNAGEIEALNDNWVNFKSIGHTPISSTAVRERLKNGEIPFELLPPSVAEYLKNTYDKA